MVSASAWVGFTFPGMIEEPGSFSGIRSSPRPARGPEASQRTSFANFISVAAVVRSAAEAARVASCPASAANLFGALTIGSPVSFAIALAARSANSGWLLIPVPTAVPPRAMARNSCCAALMRAISPASAAACAPNSCPRVSGTASCKCVRPILTTFFQASAFVAMVLWRCSSEGSRLFVTASVAAICTALGKASFDDCERLTSSFG